MYAKCTTIGETSIKDNGNLLDPDDICLFLRQDPQQTFSSGQSIYDEQGYYSQSASPSMVYSDYFSPLPDSSTTFEENANSDGYQPYECVPSQTDNYESNPKCYCSDCVKPAKASPTKQKSCSNPVESQSSLPGLYPSGAAATYIYDEAGVKYEIKKCETLDGRAQISTDSSHAAYCQVPMVSTIAMPMMIDYRTQRRIPNDPPRAMRMVKHSLTTDYLERVFCRSLFGKRLLVWDSFRCHISERTKKQLKKQDLHTAVIPGGCTKFVQAPDVVWNGPIVKVKIPRSIQHMDAKWMEWTANGNPRAPAMDVYLDWICMSWDAIPKEMIIKSFKDCGVTNCHDGSEDDLIHCFKAHGSVPEGRSMLRDARTNLEECSLAEEIDGAQDEENGYISDDSLELDWSDELNAPNPEFYSF